MKKNIVSIALNGIAIAMGVDVFVLNILGTRSTGTALTLLGLGQTALGIDSLKKE